MDRDPDFGTDRLSTAVRDYGGRHAMLSGRRAVTKAWVDDSTAPVGDASGPRRLLRR